MTFSVILLLIPLLAKAPILLLINPAYKENPYLSSHKTTKQHSKGKHTAKNINEIDAFNTKPIALRK